MFIGELLPLVLMVTGMAIVLAVAYGLKFLLRYKNTRSPFTENLLRSPGHSVRKKLEECQDDVMFYATLMMFAPVVFYAAHVSQLFFGGKNRESFSVFFLVIGTFAVLLFLAILLVKNIKKFKKLRLGYYGELATGQYLQQLVRGGYHVFHDFPAENFNIDHVAVGSGGVFAIETKARSKPLLKNGSGRDEAKVFYDGNSLKFPTWTETEPLAQAERQAKWLTEYLTKAVGEPVRAQPVLALPGWYVERTAPPKITVVNPRNFSFLLKNKVLAESMISRVAHQLEQKCRDVDLKKNDSK